jgi:glutathione S-transferase
MAQLRIFGTVISTYTRIVLITAEEADISHETIATPAHSPENRHPFGKVPVVEVDGLELYESVAVTQYIDNEHNSGALQPQSPATRAVMDKWIALANNYLFPLFEHGLVMPWIMHRVVGEPFDEAKIAKALPQVARALSFCEAEIAKDGAWVRGPFNLADVFMYPVLRGLQLTPQGASGLSQCPEITAWMEELEQRPSIQATRWQTET